MLALTLVAAGCGGEPTELLNSSSTPTPAPATAAGTTVAGGAPESPRANEITNSDAKPNELVKLSAITPKKFAKAHCARTIVVLLHQPGSTVDEQVYEELETALKGRSDIVSLAYRPDDVKEYGDLVAKLGLFGTPGLAIVDRSGRIEAFWTGYVDAKLISHTLDQAGRARPCKVTSEDAPAAGTSGPLEDAALVARGGTLAPESAEALVPGS